MQAACPCWSVRPRKLFKFCAPPPLGKRSARGGSRRSLPLLPAPGVLLYPPAGCRFLPFCLHPSSFLLPPFRFMYPQPQGPDGVLLVDKAPGMTSHDVVAIVRRAFNTKKVGHCGTLDPLATGLLIVVMGRGTKIQDLLMAEDKEYVGTMTLGTTTTSQDREGEIIESWPVPPDIDHAKVDAAFPEVPRRLLPDAPDGQRDQAGRRPALQARPPGHDRRAHRAFRPRLRPRDQAHRPARRGFPRRLLQGLLRPHLRARHRPASRLRGAPQGTAPARSRAVFDLSRTVTVDEIKTLPIDELRRRVLTLPEVSRLRGA